MKIKFLLLLLFFKIYVCGQNIKTFCPESPTDSFYVKIASFLNLQKGDTLADIGSGFGYSMIRIGHYLSGVTFYECKLPRKLAIKKLR